MNKKVLTLCVSALLASTVGAFATETPVYSKLGFHNVQTVATFTEGTSYFLKTGNGDDVLVMVKEDGVYRLKAVSAVDADLISAMWTVEPVTDSDSEGGLSFRFKNKRYGIYLSYNAADATVNGASVLEDSYSVPGSVLTWKWAKSVSTLNGQDDLYAHFNAAKDSVVYLAEGANNNIYAVKEAAGKYNGSGLTASAAIERYGVRLTTDDMNSLLGIQDPVTGKVKFSFNPEVTDAASNKFTNSEYKAVAAAGTNSVSTGWAKYWSDEEASLLAQLNDLKDDFEKYSIEANYKEWAEALKNAPKTTFFEVQKLLNDYQAKKAKVNKEPVNKAIKAFYTENVDVLNAEMKESLQNLQAALTDLSTKKADIDTKSEELAALQAWQTTFMENKLESVTTGLEALNTKFTETKNEYDAWAAEYQETLNTTGDKWTNLLNAVLSYENTTFDADLDIEKPADIDQAKVESAWETYQADAKYLREIIGSIQSVDEEILGNGKYVIFSKIVSVPKNVSASINENQFTKDWPSNGYKVDVDVVTEFFKSISEAQTTNAEIINTEVAKVPDIILYLEKVVAHYETMSAYQGEELNKLTSLVEDLQYQANEFDQAWWEVKDGAAELIGGEENEGFGQKLVSLSTDIENLVAAANEGMESYAAITKAIEITTTELETLNNEYNNLETSVKSTYDELKVTFSTGALTAAFQKVTAAYETYIDNLTAAYEAQVAYTKAQGQLDNLYTTWSAYRDFEIQMWKKWDLEAHYGWAKAYASMWGYRANLYFSLEKSAGNYLMVDTTYMTEMAGRQYVGFDVKKFAQLGTNWLTTTPAQMDINGRINFMNVYYPSNDSLVLRSEGKAIKYADTKYWEDMSGEIYENYGNTVMVKVLTDGKREVTIAHPDRVNTSNLAFTLNTRISLAQNETATPSQLAEGIYLIQKKDNQGMYYVDNFLGGKMGLTAPKAQEFKHIPAAQWVVKALANSTYNTIVNRESENILGDKGNFQNVQLYSLGANTYKTEMGDTIYVTNITDEVKGKETLGYVALPDDKNPDADYRSYALDYLNGVAEGLARISVVEEDGQLTVAATEAPMYFTFETEKGDTIAYGATVAGEKQLKKVAYRIKAENNYNHAGEADRYITLATDGSYVLGDKEDAAKFWLKEFKHNASGVCYYVLINTKGSKVSVQDYPTVLLDETLETATIDEAQERTSAFALTEKAEPKYRRLGATVEGDGFEADAPANATFHHVGYENVTLYENALNKGAGTSANPSKPTGVNFLGQFNSNDLSANAAIYVDTAYVRNDTKRPQYLLALRPDFTPLLEPCPEDPTHPAHEIAQTKADYLVVLNDSINNKDAKEKMYQFQGYTRLAFVPATHRRDTLIIENSKFTGTKDAAKDSIYLGKNEYNNATFQFLLAEESETYGDFYIEVAKNAWLKIHNEIPVIVNDITKADIFNINTTTDAPTANESIVAGKVSVVATDGAVIVKGAEGKNVIVSTILGKVVANEVLNSDNETIAAPAGIVVVSVDGESFKVAVK